MPGCNFEMARMVISELGGLKLTDAPEEFQKRPKLPLLFTNAARPGWEPRGDLQWKEAATNYEFTWEEVFACQDAHALVELVKERRAPALVRMMDALEAVSPADPLNWRAVLCKDEWMQEMPVAKGGFLTVFVGCLVAFTARVHDAKTAGVDSGNGSHHVVQGGVPVGDAGSAARSGEAG